MADMNTADRRKAAASGKALPDRASGGRFPITNRSDLEHAIRALGRARGDHAVVRRFIIKRAKALNLTNLIPDNWQADGSLKK